MPSLLEVLQDPNYTGANQATKEAIFNKYAPQDPLYADANPATQEAIRAKYGFGVVKKEEEKPIVQQKKPEDVGYLEGSLESLKRGVGGYKESGAGTSLALSSILGDEEAARKKMEAIKAENKKVEEKPGLTVADLERIYEEKGLASAAGQVPKYISQQLLQSAPEMAGPLAVGAGVSMVATPLVGTLAGMGAYGIQQFGHFLARQAEEKQDPKELEVAKAAITAGATAPLGYMVDKWTAGLASIGEKKAGQEILKELSARQIALQTGKRAAAGAGIGIIAEAPLEVVEQAAERWQAGLPLTGEDAYKEYKEAFFGAAAAGGSIGAASRGIKGYAQAKAENIQAREEAQSTGKNTFDEGAEYESTGADTGVSKQGVLAFNEQEVGTDQTARGTGELNASGLGTTSTSTERTAGGESVQQRALIEKEQFNNWLKEHGIIPTSEKEINMYEDMWRREQNLTGATTVDKGQAAKREVTEEEQNLIKVIRSGENWLRENPDDAHYQEAVNVVNRNRAALKALQEEQQTISEPRVLASKGVSKQGGFDFNAPEQTTPEQTTPEQTAPTPPKVSFKQEGFDFGAADANTQREIIDETPSKGFELSAPSGQVLKGNGVEIIDGPPIAKLDLATENVDSVEAFINSIKPDTQTEQQLQNIDVDKKSILKTIKEFLGLPITYKPQLTEEEKAQGITEKPLAIERGAELDDNTFNRRLGVINTFFNTLSLAPQERQQRLQDLRKALPGLNVQQQKQAFAEFFNIKNLNSARGIKELRSNLEEWLDKYEGALLGEGKSNAVLGEGRFGIGWRKGQYVVRTGDKINLGPVMKAALDRLKSKHPDQRTPEEKAAYIFFSRKSPYEQPFVFALRNAAYLLNKSKINKKGELIKQGPVYKGETKENAVLFRKWLKENAPDKILDYFDATAQDFRTQFERAEKVSEEMRKAKAATKSGMSASDMPWLFRKPTGKVENFERTAGLGMDMKPSKPVVIKSEDFIELGVNPEEFGKHGQVLRPDLLKQDAYYPLHPAVESCIANNDLNGALKIMATSADAYTRGVAEKFLSLGLKTATVFDKQDTISINYINWAYSPENSSRTKVFNFLKDTVPDLDTNVIKIPTTIAEMQEQLSMLEKLQNYDLITPVKPDLESIIKSYSGVIDAHFNAKGAYYPGIDTINFNRKFVVSNNDFIHEVAHAASNYALSENNFEKLTPKQQKAVSELKKLYAIAKNEIESNNLLDVYGITDVDEFVSEAFSNVEFQALLKAIPYKYVSPTQGFKLTPDKKAQFAQKRVQVASPEAPTQPIERNTESLWDKFTRLIAQLIGMDNVLGHTLANANIILQATPAVDYASDVQNALVYASKGKPNTMALNGTRQTAPPRQGFVDRIFSGRPTWEAMKTSMPFWLESLDDSLRKHYLGAFTLRQLDDMVGRRLPPFTEFIKNVENMLDARNSVLTETKDVILPWQKFQEKHPELAKVLNRLMIDATVETIDPSKFTSTNYYNTGSLDAFNALSKTDREKRRALAKAYSDIGPEGQKIYKDVKDFYARRLAAYKTSLLDRIRDVLINEGIKETDVTKHPSYKKIEEYFRRHTLEPYFPLKRFGDYWLVINKAKGQAKEYYQFESALERNAFAAKRKKEIGPNVEIDMGNSLRDSKWKGSIKDLEFLKELKDLVRTGEGNDVKTLKGNLEEALENLYLLQLPDQNVRKMFLPRQGTAGMDQDMLRAFSSSAFHMAYQHSRFKFGPKLFNSVKQADSFLTDMGNPTEEKKLRDYIGELSKRVDFIMNPPDTGKLPSFLSNVSFIWYMTAPASALVNMLGVVAVGQPVLATRFGQAQTAKTMIGYAKRVGKSGFKDQNGDWAFPSITRDPNLTDVQKRATERFAADGLFDITLSHDIVGLAESSSNLYTGRTKKVMGVLSALFHGAEKFNREVVAMSAFDMAMKKYAKPENGGYKGDKLFEKAVEVTKDLTYKSMFDYSTLNKPRFFQGKWAKVALQFKQFSQQMSYLIGRSGLEGFSKMYNYDVLIEKEKQLGPNQQLPELQDVRQQINAIQRDNGEPEYQGDALEAQLKKYYDELRREGRDRLYGTLGMTFAFAGTTGLPGWWALSKLAEALEAVFCDDDDDEKPFDFNNWYKNWLSDNFGGFWGDSISRGIMSQVSGVNLADRMGLNDLWFRDPRASKDETDALQNMLIGLMGPSVGLMVSATDAMKQMREGHLERAMETMSPAILKDILKAGRFSETFGEGKATTLKGDVLIDDFGVGEVASQALGFSSERLAQRQKANIEMKTAEQEILTKRQALLNAFFMSIDNSDDDLRERTIEKIIKFNSSNPGASITGSNLSRSVLNRYRQRSLAQITGGMNIQKKLISELGGMAAYGDE